jgi:opacity protein-like surface antigen
MSIRVLTLAVALIAAPSAFAADPSGHPRGPVVIQAPEVPQTESLYAVLRGGISDMSRTGFAVDSATPAFPTADVVNRYRTGQFFSAALGLDTGEIGDQIATRFEVELGFLRNRAASHTLTSVPAQGAMPIVTRFSDGNARGSTEAFFGMVNYYADWRFGRFRPFVGAGVGLAQVNFRRHGVSALVAPVMDDSDMSIAWQIGAGLAFEVTRSITIEAGYRYFRIDDVNLTTSDLGAPGARISSTTSIAANQFYVGARVRF